MFRGIDMLLNSFNQLPKESQDRIMKEQMGPIGQQQ